MKLSASADVPGIANIAADPDKRDATLVGPPASGPSPPGVSVLAPALAVAPPGRGPFQPPRRSSGGSARYRRCGHFRLNPVHQPLRLGQPMGHPAMLIGRSGVLSNYAPRAAI